MVKIYAEDVSNLENDYFFDDEKVIIVNKYGETERVYGYLEAIYEEKDYYYIFTTKKNCHIMRKDSFQKGNEEEFHEFIKEKMGKNYKKRCHRKKIARKNNIEEKEEKKTAKLKKNSQIKNNNLNKKIKSKK